MIRILVVSHLLMQTLHIYLNWGIDDVVAPGDVPVPPYLRDTTPVRRDIARHYNNIHTMDMRVGEVLARLEADGLAGDTIVILTTDHRPPTTDHRPPTTDHRPPTTGTASPGASESCSTPASRSP